MHLILEREASGHLSPKTAFGVWAEVVRAEAGGMGVKFIMRNRNEEREFQRFLGAVLGEGVREAG